MESAGPKGFMKGPTVYKLGVGNKREQNRSLKMNAVGSFPKLSRFFFFALLVHHLSEVFKAYLESGSLP